MILTHLEYLRRFSMSERLAIRIAAKTNIILEDYLHLMELAQEIDTDDDDTILALMTLQSLGFVTAERRVEILGHDRVVPLPLPPGTRNAYIVPNTFMELSEYEAFVRSLPVRWSSEPHELIFDGLGYVEVTGVIEGYEPTFVRT